MRNKKLQGLLGCENGKSKVRNASYKRRKKKMLIALFSAVGVIFAVVVIILINSPGKLEPLKNEQGNVIQGSVSEKIWVDINGIKQGMFIRGENIQNPVILYLHGGPGTPMLQFISYLEQLEKTNERLEKYFTVCYWDQRGAGMTYSKSADSATMTVAQMVEDTHEVTEYLKSRFNQEKIYLLGHSWGSYLGVKTIEKYPENYLAYIGIGQVTNQTESERLAYDYMLSHAKDIGDKDVIERLKKYDPYADDFPTLEYLVKGRTDAMIKYGVGHLHQGLPEGMTFNGMVFRALFRFKGYTLSEKINWFLGADFSMVQLFPIILEDDLFTSSAKFEIPFYIVQGDYDYQVSRILAEKYLDILEAPYKEFIAFSNSAHSPNLEESEKFIEVFCKIATENPLKK
ncbi:MAG: alpha/beta hydrolase [Propionibacteriaceae bacterium]|nr:alpha/beta hydrolase [Propionibacteriaceae bacterium]